MGAGAAIRQRLLYATFVNNWIDANRSEHDIDLEVLNELWPGLTDPSEKARSIGMVLIHSRARGRRAAAGIAFHLGCHCMTSIGPAMRMTKASGTRISA